MDWLNNNLGTSLGALVVWGFLMALLFNLMMRFVKENYNDTLLFTSFAMFTSYFISDHFWELYNLAEIYLIWFFYDVGTIVLISLFIFFTKKEIPKGSKYIFIGLCINSILLLSMYIDIRIYRNDLRWWLWDLYSAGVNIIDFIMIVALILDRDYLGVIRLSKLITSPIQKKALN